MSDDLEFEFRSAVLGVDATPNTWCVLLAREEGSDEEFVLCQLHPTIRPVAPVLFVLTPNNPLEFRVANRGGKGKASPITLWGEAQSSDEFSFDDDMSDEIDSEMEASEEDVPALSQASKAQPQKKTQPEPKKQEQPKKQTAEIAKLEKQEQKQKDTTERKQEKAKSVEPEFKMKSVEPEIKMIKGGITYKDLRIGQGAEARVGSRVQVRYTGRFPNGKVFDSNMPRGKPLQFTIGANDVVKGFELVTTGMKVGGLRSSVLPPEFAYGKRGAPPDIPPNATLMFDIELVKTN